MIQASWIQNIEKKSYNHSEKKSRMTTLTSDKVDFKNKENYQ